MKGYTHTITINQKYHNQVTEFMDYNKIFVNYDFTNYGCVIYYFQNPFDYGITVEFIEETLKTKDIK